MYDGDHRPGITQLLQIRDNAADDGQYLLYVWSNGICSMAGSVVNLNLRTARKLKKMYAGLMLVIRRER